MTNGNIITTSDGYLYTQLPSGWYTDGDVEFDYNNTDIMGVVWHAYTNSKGRVYCADGDGFVAVAELADGTFEVQQDQGDFVSRHDSLREAMFAAQAILAKDYPTIYAELVGE